MVPRDFKERPARKKSAPRKSRRSVAAAPARWPAFLAGVCVGAVATVVLFLYEPGTGVDLAARVDSATKDVRGDESKPTFEFYTMLPEKEIVIPETSLDEPPPATSGTDLAPPRKPATDDGVRYVLQVASLRKHEDADRLKARLALIGLESSIQTVSVDGSETWHRVRVGPFIGRAALNDARAQLSRNNFPVLVMRLK
jgi:cell division protein FtsN